MALLRTSAAVAMAFGFGLTAPLDAQQPAAPDRRRWNNRLSRSRTIESLSSPRWTDSRSLRGVERQEVPAGDGGTVTVIRPVKAGDEEEDMRSESTRGEELIGK